MSEPVRWGVLGCADIAVKKVIPAMLTSEMSRVVAVASRTTEKAERTAKDLGISRFYGSYEAMLTDDEIEAVYIPLPNHIHREWTLAAVDAGKHVLCEKPLATTSADVREMVEAAHGAGVKLMEAFMYRLHPLWIEVRRLVSEGAIGDLLAVQSFFSYHNVDPDDIRNQVSAGGGALYDIGCYPVNAARMLFEGEPESVSAVILRDPRFGTDVLTTAVLDFGGRHASFTCSTQLENDQRVHVAGTEGRLAVEIPFNIPTDRPTRVLRFAGGDPPVSPKVEVHEVAPANQYAVQADAFSRAVRDDTPVPTAPEDAVANLEVIEAIFADAARRN